MGVLALLDRATSAGLTLEVVGDRIKMTGPPSAAAVVREVAAHKLEVLEHLAARQPVLPPCTRCGNPFYNLVAIHNGQSSRRDCARCKLTAAFPHSFPVWKGISAARSE